MNDVFIVGALHLDVVVDAPRLPALDETLMGKRVSYRFGGKGGNQALAAARVGAKVAIAGRVGLDEFGAKILEALRNSRVDHSQVLQVPGATGMSVAIVEEGGEYGAVVVSGVNQTIDPLDIDPGASNVILLQNEIPETINLAVAKSKRPDTKLVLNAAPARQCSTELLDSVDLLVVNRVEAAQMTGKPETTPEDAAAALASLGPKAVVVTVGREGAVIFERGSVKKIVPPIQANGSAHGAGDAFVGVLVSELAKRWNLISAATFASAAAAHFVHTPPNARESINRSALDNWIAGL
ncbi:PfkB family carbohydrate kinase [Ruegeria arenilitoris]|uniref:PfkB family carbohydrate kinase n=1 Tax=Ruegeria arenilitoris TaxID=1173585 RepID=UPI00147FA6E8|nr:PfkB family carbohydrate kinase [Ruegeria arenilitoris]